MTDIIVYLKAPEPGQVKTRLHTRYREDESAALYRAFILDTFDMVVSVEADRYFAAYAGARDGIDALVPPGWNLSAQIDADLGERMLGSLRASIDSGADKVVLLGTDLPSLPAGHLVSALTRLNESDVVLGPTMDGGFYLIATRCHLPDIFPGIAWSTDKVFEQSSERIQSHGLRLGKIPPWNDIDTPEDLDSVLLHSAEPTVLQHTREALARLRR